MNMKNIVISPSLICADLCNLAHEVKLLEKAGIKSLHVDLIEPHFSPSMPIGLEVVRQLKKMTTLDFDTHIMATCNEFFIEQLIDMKVSSITFHCETTLHSEKMLQKIKAANIKAGIALNPSTQIEKLEYIGESCDYILLMLINPGYADGSNEEMVQYAFKKISDCRKFLNEHKYNAKIIVDGRVSFEAIPDLIKAGAEVLVAGSKSIFRAGYTYEENHRQLINLIENIK